MGSIFKDVFASVFGTTPVTKDFFSPNLPPPPQTVVPALYNSEDGSYLFEAAGGRFEYFKYQNYESCVDAYRRCPTVAAITNRKALAFTNGKTWVLNSRGKEATSTQADTVRALMAAPNPLQTWRLFEAQLYLFFQNFGFAIILPVMPTGYTDFYEATSLWNIPASWIDIPATQESFNRLGATTLTEIILNFGGARVTLQIKDLIIIRDSMPSFTTLTFPASKLQSLAMPINNIIGAYESRNTLINYRGALGILTQDFGKGQYVPTPMTPIEKTDLQQDFKRYGLRARQFNVILTTASLKWQQMGYPTKDLMLMEEVQESSKAICDGLGFPPHLMGLIDPTFNNQNTAEKFGLYQNNVIPDAHNIYEQLTAAFGIIRYNLQLNKDFSELPVLQDDRKTQAEARMAMNRALEIEWRNGMITLNQWLVKNGEDPLTDERGKMFFPEYVARFGDPGTRGSLTTTNTNNDASGQTGSGQQGGAQGQ